MNFEFPNVLPCRNTLVLPTALWFCPFMNSTSSSISGCYFGRGAIQISYNYNYGLFNRWLKDEGITHNGKPVDILENPNLVMTKTDPPLSILASMWFYMTPQSPKPSMHDIVIGNKSIYASLEVGIICLGGTVL